jgi:hypothetical protein
MQTTELVKSLSIDNLVNQRAAVVERLGQAVTLIREAAQIASVGHLGMPRLHISTGYSRGHGSAERAIADARLGARRDGSTWEHEAGDRAEVDRIIRLGVDAAAWQYLMHESGLRSLMDAKARADWDRSISEGEIPELTDANIRSTFQMLHDARGDIFERGVIACFKSLAWSYKTNLPHRFGKRIVMTYLRNSVSGGKWGSSGTLGYVNHSRCDALDDLSRVFAIVDGRPEPDHRSGWYSRLSTCAKVGDPDAADDYLSIRSYRNGHGHVTFKKPALVDELNRIIARHFPGCLPAPK